MRETVSCLSLVLVLVLVLEKGLVYITGINHGLTFNSPCCDVTWRTQLSTMTTVRCSNQALMMHVIMSVHCNTPRKALNARSVGYDMHYFKLHSIADKYV